MRKRIGFICTKCDHRWSAPVDIEYGIINMVHNEDAYCRECGAEGEEADFDERAAMEEYRYEVWKAGRVA
jgi:hypothetical protein